MERADGCAEVNRTRLQLFRDAIDHELHAAAQRGEEGPRGSGLAVGIGRRMGRGAGAWLGNHGLFARREHRAGEAAVFLLHGDHARQNSADTEL